MKRLTLLVLLVACGGNDQVPMDASTDQGADSTLDAPNDVAPKDGGSDASDATIDVTGDAIADVVTDAPVVDVISVDAGNTCSSNANCSKSDFCDKGTANCGGNGVCKPVPQNCPQIYNPVCGCDKKTYSNSCFANAAGVSVAYTGVCE